eukprot:TRINITY_DN12533_c0_g1_i1.p1 TRINITY_DN12533_c0_g1~~TRINITY_DN12533_c0_g1_i1.p1  ORF type:complete len:1012 (-),score=186.07 TRINITY_DN12533_c0_g1_i1:59-2773(-)
MAAAMCISYIAHWDWPEKWPDLVPNLLNCLSSHNIFLVEGAMSCLEAIAAGDNATDEQLPSLVTLTFPPLLQIVAETGSKFDERIKMRAVSVVSACIEWLYTTKSSNTTMLATFQTLMPHWIQSFQHHLSIVVPPNHFFGLKIAILNTVSYLIHTFPEMKNEIDRLLVPIWSFLVGLKDGYEEMAIKNDALTQVVGFRDGESALTYGLAPFISSSFEVFNSLLSKSKYRPLLKNHLPQLFYLIIGYMQMTEEQIDVYDSDPNQWVADEDDETLELSVRISTSKLIQKLFQCFKQDCFTPFAEAISKRLQESNEFQLKGEKMWWKLRESIICAVGLVSGDLISSLESFDLRSFCKNVLLNDINSPVPFLRGRALWCASTIGKILSVDELAPFLLAASTTLNSPTDPIPVKIFACRAIGNLCPRLQGPMVVSYMDGIMGGLVGIINVLSKETLYLLLETFHVLLPLSEEVSLKYLTPIANALLVLWAHHYKDGILVSHMTDIFADFASSKSCHLILQEKIGSTLINLLRQFEKRQLVVVESTIDIVTTILMPQKNMVAPVMMDHLFPLLCEIMMKSNESSVLNAGTHALRAYVRNAGPLLLSWKSESMETGMDLIFKVIARLLSPSIPDDAAMGAGYLIEKVMMTFSGQIGGVLDGLLTSVLNRLQASSESTLHQGLLMVFVRLFFMDTAQSINFLLSKGVQQLSFILREWTQQHSNFRGAFKIKLSIMAFGKLFQSVNPVLNSITVPGDIVELDTRAKRSKKQKEVYAEEPIKLRIFKILVREYQVILEDLEGDAELGSDSDDFDLDDEDEEETLKNIYNELNQKEGSDPFVPAEDVFGLEDFFQEEEKEDPDIKDEPIYNVNLKEFISGFLKAFAEQDRNSFLPLANALPPLDKECLNKLFSTR